MQLRSVGWMDGWISHLISGTRRCRPPMLLFRSGSARSTNASLNKRAADTCSRSVRARSPSPSRGAVLLRWSRSPRVVPASGVWTTHGEVGRSPNHGRRSSSVVPVVWYGERDVTWPVRGILRAHNVACRPLARTLGVQ
jgi:hypothetical protein